MDPTRAATILGLIILIDGDDAPFLYACIKAGGVGGVKAAVHLHDEIRAYMKDLYPGLNPPIKVTIYLGLDDQARTYENQGITTRDVLDQFVGKFNALAHLNIINVGRGSQRADLKFEKNFRFCLWNKKCKHIIVTGLHDRGYVNILTETIGRKEQGRVTLLQTTVVREGFESSALK